MLKDLTYWQAHRDVLIWGILIAVGQAVLIATLLVHRFRRARFQKELDERLKFEELISKISARFVNLHFSQVEAEVLNALEGIRRAADLDRCHLFAFLPAEKKCQIHYHAEAPGTPSIPSVLEEASLPSFFNGLREGGVLRLEDLDRDLPPNASEERAFAAAHGIQSVLVVPVRRSEGIARGLCCHSTRRKRIWPKDLISRLQLVGEILVSGLVEKQAEEALRQSEERNRAIREAIPDLMFLMDLNGVYLDYHAANPQLLLVAPEKFLGRNMREVLPPDLAERLCRCFETVKETSEPNFLEYQLPLDGRDCWFEARMVRCGKDQILSVIRDITDRKNVENDLRLSEERYREMVETQTDLVCRYLPDGTLTFVNEAYCRFFKLSKKALIGSKFLELIPESSREAALNHIQALLANPYPRTIEHEVILPDATIGWQQWVDYPIFDDQDQIREFQAIGRDITDRKRAEEARQTLAHVSRLAVVGELTAMIAHEINQPLGAILNNADAAELLLERTDPPLDDVRQILADIKKNDLRASEAILRIRSLLRKKEMQIRPLDLNEVIRDAIHIATGDALRRRVPIIVDLANEPARIMGDQAHIQHVLLNLLVNAMDAMVQTPPEARRLTISTLPSGNEYTEVAVKDAGHGIPSEQLSRIFDSFFSTKKDGMGLGLSIARAIIDSHQGRIWAENNPSGGATLRFTLPNDGVAHSGVIAPQPEMAEMARP